MRCGAVRCKSIHNTNIQNNYIHPNNNNNNNIVDIIIIIYSNFLKVNCFPWRNLSESIFPQLQSKPTITTFEEFSFFYFYDLHYDDYGDVCLIYDEWRDDYVWVF